MSPPTPATARPRALERSRFLVLLVVLVAMVGLLPMTATRGHSALGLDAALLAVLIACIWSMGQRKRAIALGCVLLVPAAAAAWLAGRTSSTLLPIVGLFCAVAFISLTALAMLVNIVRQQDVSTDTVLGGICVYLLIAVIWALVYAILERLQPGSFGPWPTASGAPAPNHLVSPEFVYYSLLSLGTLGPQDVHPRSGAALSWTGLEAIVGQMYLAVLIARLVGRHASRR